jgi:putative phosphoribosyl transferase
MREGFRDRRDAGRQLAAKLAGLGDSDVVVLALPRGGVPVAYEVASNLGLPLDVFVVRKLGVPGQEELAMGAIASGGTRVENREVLGLLGIGDSVLEAVTERERRELERRERVYRGSRPLVEVAGRKVVLVDDGVATGSTMLAAVRALRSMGATWIVVATPVAARTVVSKLRAEADEVVCVLEPDWLEGISLWYDDFEQTPDAEVHALLASPAAAGLPPGAGADTSREAAGGARGSGKSAVGAGGVEAGEIPVAIDAGGVQLAADLGWPARAKGLVLFAHGSGSGRRSPRNRAVAAELQRAGLATLLADLLTADEERIDQRTRHLRFDIPLLTNRLVGIVDWAEGDPRTAGLDLGLFGASTGAAAALMAAARRPERVRAVVSRGGRPDLAMDALPLVRCPALLIVGGLDFTVLELNREALAALRGTRELEIVPGATHLFEEPGALEKVAALARDWFLRHAGGAGAAPVAGAAGTPRREGV